MLSGNLLWVLSGTMLLGIAAGITGTFSFLQKQSLVGDLRACKDYRYCPCVPANRSKGIANFNARSRHYICIICVLYSMDCVIFKNEG